MMSEVRDVADDLRAGLRRLAKAVVVITTRHEGQRHAMAATAVSELSMDPPSLLLCVNRGASLHGPLAAGAPFCVNILHAGQEALSALCSGREKGEARFASGAWAGDEDGPPWLEDAQASFVCVYEDRMEYGTHSVIIGRVTDVRLHGDVDPLVYVDGRYTRVA